MDQAAGNSPLLFLSRVFQMKNQWSCLLFCIMQNKNFFIVWRKTGKPFLLRK